MFTLMMHFKKSFKKSLMILFLISILWTAWAVQRPNQELHFTREVVSELSPERLDRNIASVTRWPQWFHSLSEVTVLPSGTLPSQPIPNSIQRSIQVGDLLKLKMTKPFELTARVLEYIPNQKMKLAILADSSGKMTRIFDQLTWSIELMPHPKGSVIRGEATAHTCHWRSRMLGDVAEKILMNQVFYPNLIKLSLLRQPFSVEPPPLGSGIGTP